MVRTWLILDVNYLVWRGYYAGGWASRSIARKAPALGLRRDLESLSLRFGSDDFVFCFDGDLSLRKEQFPDYKANRLALDNDPRHRADRAAVRRGIREARDQYLKELGYRNVFWRDGYEADDVIAGIVNELPARQNAILVSGDKDLYQLLTRPNVTIFRPREREVWDRVRFVKEYGIHPRLWPEALAIGGEEGDNIPGAPGVRLKTALRYLRGEMTAASPPLQSIMKWCAPHGKVHLNIRMTTLPFPGQQAFRPQPQHTVDDENWDLLAERLGVRGAPGFTDRGVRSRMGI